MTTMIRAAPGPRRAGRIARRRFPGRLSQVAAARVFLASVLGGCPAADDAILCASELCANAVVHSASRLPGGTFTVTVRTAPGRVRVEVSDDGGPWGPPARDQERPHGLRIVAALATACGTDGSAGEGWTAWFEIGQAAAPGPPGRPTAGPGRGPGPSEQAGEQERDDPGEEHAVECPRPSDGGHRGAEAPHLPEVGQVGADQRAERAAHVGQAS